MMLAYSIYFLPNLYGGIVIAYFFQLEELDCKFNEIYSVLARLSSQMDG